MEEQIKDLSVSAYGIKMNLIEDWNNLLNNRMIDMGYKPKVRGYKSLDYYKAIKKLILPYPRKIFYSKEFSCPDDCKEALIKLTKDIENGINLLPYMSKQVIKPSKNDGLLNDWGIHHFHLNEALEERTKFIKRSDWLLMAYVNKSSICFLNIYPHKKPHLWSHIRLVEIIYNNWPDIIEKNRMSDVFRLSDKLDDETYSKLRKANISTFVELGENKIFCLIGGGYASDGSSLEAVIISNYWHNYIRKVELCIREEFQSIKKYILALDPSSMEKILEIKLLMINEESLILLEKQRNAIIEMNLKSGNTKVYTLSDLLEEFSMDSWRNKYAKSINKKFYVD